MDVTSLLNPQTEVPCQPTTCDLQSTLVETPRDLSTTPHHTDSSTPTPFKPVISESTVSEPTISEPAVFGPRISEPVVFGPRISEPTIPEPATLEPAILEPAIPGPTTPEPAIPESTIPNPATPNPAIPNPTASGPTTPKPTQLFPIFFTNTQRVKKRKADELSTPPVKFTQSRAVGVSHSARIARERNKQVSEGTFVIDNRLFLRFKRKIRLVDPDAVFEVSGNVKLVTHSLCGQSVTMKEPYNTSRFLQHLDRCKGSPETATPLCGGITKFLVRTMAPLRSIPCPGLNGSQHERIPIYLQRSSAPGGGATSRTIISRELYDGNKYAQLSKVQKANVRRLQVLRFRWVNDHHEGRVFSTRCLRMVSAREGVDEVDPCTECMALLSLGSLRNALRRPIPDDKNLKYTPKECLGTLLGKLYAAHLGLREIMESPVRIFLMQSCSTLG